MVQVHITRMIANKVRKNAHSDDLSCALLVRQFMRANDGFSLVRYCLSVQWLFQFPFSRMIIPQWLLTMVLQ